MTREKIAGVGGAILLFAGLVLLPVGVWVDIKFLPTGIVIMVVGLALLGYQNSRR